ncbi:MAG: hypothetical protein JWQ98_1051 [Chlorobi bacterium]|nr:hypothetical protein [Chlorobiota bacterium]
MDFPFGDKLVAIEGKIDKRSTSDMCFDEITVVFEEKTIVLLPLPDTDEINIEVVPTIKSSKRRKRHQLFPILSGKALLGVWICNNDQGYQDLMVLAFEYLQPNIGVLAEGSVLKVLQMDVLQK